MPVDHLVGTLEEALALAESWKAAGTHLWFRGQASEKWELQSSLSRYVTTDPHQAIEVRYGRFASWLQDQDGLSHLLDDEHVHGFFAVAQHHGIPTHYVDFTTEPAVAGFFATHDTAAVPGTQGCIIGLDPDAFVSTLRAVAQVKGHDRDKWPEQVSVKVPGLWRMQAQSGHFVYLSHVGVEKWYGYDRILFTHAASSPGRSSGAGRSPRSRSVTAPRRG